MKYPNSKSLRVPVEYICRDFLSLIYDVREWLIANIFIENATDKYKIFYNYNKIAITCLFLGIALYTFIFIYMREYITIKIRGMLLIEITKQSACCIKSVEKIFSITTMHRFCWPFDLKRKHRYPKNSVIMCMTVSTLLFYVVVQLLFWK